MANSLLQCSGTGTTNNSTVTFNPWVGALAADATETDVQVICRLPGVASKLLVEVSTNLNTSAATVKTRKALANGGQSASITASTTGLFQDTTGTDTINAADKMDYQTTPGSSNSLTINVIQVVFAATTNTASKLAASGTPASISTTGVTDFWQLCGAFTQQTTETNMKTRIRKVGTFKNLYILITSSSGNSTSNAAVLRDNAANSALTITPTINTTGFFEDTTHTVTSVAGHDYDYAFNPPSILSTLTVGSMGVEFETTTGVSIMVSGNAAGTNVTKGATNFMPIGGGSPTSAITTETFAQSFAQDSSFTIDNLGVMISANGTTAGTNSVTVDKNATATALTVSFTTTTGLLEDNTHSVTGIATGDLLSTKFINAQTGGGVHDITFIWIAMHITASASVIINIPQTLLPLYQWIES